MKQGVQPKPVPERSTDAASHALVVLNSFVLALFDFFDVGNAKQQMRYLDAQPLRAVQLLLSSLGEN